MDKGEKEILNLIRSILISSSKRGKSVREIQREFREIVGKNIPIFEYKSLEESRHISKYLAEQKESKKKVSSGFKNNFRSYGCRPLTPRSYSSNNKKLHIKPADLKGNNNVNNATGSTSIQFQNQATMVFTFDELQLKENHPQQNQIEESINIHQRNKPTIVYTFDELQQKENNLVQKKIYNNAMNQFSSSGNSELRDSTITMVAYENIGCSHHKKYVNDRLFLAISKPLDLTSQNGFNRSVKESPVTQQWQMNKKCLNQLGTPIFTLFKNNNGFQCYVNIDNIRYSTYPMCYENENEARFESAKYAMKCLLSCRQEFDVCLDNEVNLTIKLRRCIKDNPADVFVTKIPEIFFSIYKQLLPPDWMHMVKIPKTFYNRRLSR